MTPDTRHPPKLPIRTLLAAGALSRKIAAKLAEAVRAK